MINDDLEQGNWPIHSTSDGRDPHVTWVDNLLWSIWWIGISVLTGFIIYGGIRYGMG